MGRRFQSGWMFGAVIVRVISRPVSSRPFISPVDPSLWYRPPFRGSRYRLRRSQGHIDFRPAAQKLALDCLCPLVGFRSVGNQVQALLCRPNTGPPNRRALQQWQRLSRPDLAELSQIGPSLSHLGPSPCASRCVRRGTPIGDPAHVMSPLRPLHRNPSVNAAAGRLRRTAKDQ